MNDTSIDLNNLKAGQKYMVALHHEPLRIMAIVENYVVWRYKGCAPAIHTLKDFKDFLLRQQAALV